MSETPSDNTNMRAIIVAALILIAFAVLVGFMLTLALRISTVTGEVWARTTYIYGSVEALAFTFPGFFFGKEVHRARAERAEKRAATEANKAAAANQEAATAAKSVAEKQAAGSTNAVQEERRKGIRLANERTATVTFLTPPDLPASVGAGVAPVQPEAGVAALRRAGDRIRELAALARGLFPCA